MLGKTFSLTGRDVRIARRGDKTSPRGMTFGSNRIPTASYLTPEIGDAQAQTRERYPAF